jgi:hypothetical protein
LRFQEGNLPLVMRQFGKTRWEMFVVLDKSELWLLAAEPCEHAGWRVGKVNLLSF